MFKKQIGGNKSLDGGRGLHISNGSADFRKLVMLLYESILHHDYNLTEKIMEAVCKWPFQGGELPLKMVKEVTLCHAHIDGTSHDIMKVIKQAVVLSNKYRIENLLNVVFFLLLRNDFEEAYQTLLRSINSDPYDSSPLCHGYVGMLAYYFWLKERKDRTNAHDQHSLISEVKDSHSQLCIHHFSQVLHVLSVLPATINRGQYDLFLTLQVKSLEHMGKIKDIRELLDKYLKIFPSSINAHRLKLKYMYIRDHDGSLSDADTDNEEESLLNIDPSSCEVLPLIEDMLIKGNKSAVKHLMVFLDYPHNHGCERAWSLLKNLPSTLEKERELLWTSRWRWWGKLHHSKVHHPRHFSSFKTCILFSSKQYQ